MEPADDQKPGRTGFINTWQEWIVTIIAIAILLAGASPTIRNMIATALIGGPGSYGVFVR